MHIVQAAMSKVMQNTQIATTRSAGRNVGTSARDTKNMTVAITTTMENIMTVIIRMP